MPDLRATLTDPRCYAFTQRFFGARRARRRIVERYLLPKPGDRILDIGCGTGDLLEMLPEVDYVGFDLSAEYIDAARRRYGHRATFHHADIQAADLTAEAPFDLVTATGVLHHLDGAGAQRLMTLAAGALAADGRLVTFDGVHVPGQSVLARWLLEHDRGAYIRTPDEYLAVCRPHFADVRCHVVSDFLYVPYTHCILDARAPRR